MRKLLRVPGAVLCCLALDMPNLISNNAYVVRCAKNTLIRFSDFEDVGIIHFVAWHLVRCFHRMV